MRIVEGEQPRFDFLDGEARDRAGELGRENRLLAAVGVFRKGQAVGQLESGLEGIGEAGFQIGPYHDPVDHHLDIVPVILVERRGFVDLVHFAVDLDALEAALLQHGQFAAVFALAPPRDRRQQVKPRAFRHGHHDIDHLADRLRFDRQAGGGRVGDADARV